jgi:general secretion pathway protein L
VEGAAAGAPPSERLWIGGAAPGNGRGSNLLTYALLGVALSLAIVAVAIPIATTHRHAAAMAEEFAATRKIAEGAAALRKEIEALREEQNFLLDRKRHSPTLTIVISDLTRILPDDTWLTELQVVGNEVQLSGVTASASGLVGILEQSGVVRNTAFRSPVTRDPASGRERFGIAAQLHRDRSP